MCLNVAYIGGENRNSFLARLLGLYNSNNLTTKISEGDEKITEELENILNERKKTIDNDMPIIWNFKMKGRNVNIYSIEPRINDVFNNSLIQCEIGLFYIDSETSVGNELKNQILLANILGIKSVIVYINIPEDKYNTKIINKTRELFTNRNFKKNRIFVVTKFNRQELDNSFNSYLRMEQKRKNIDSNVCVPINNVFQLSNRYSGVNATIVRGNVELNGFLKNSRTGATYKIDELQVAHVDTKMATKGALIGMKIKNASELSVGDILVSSDEIVNNYTLITAQVLLINDKINRDSVLSINTIGRDSSVKVVNIVKTINNLNKTIEKKPNELKHRETGIIIFQSREKLPLKLYSKDYTLGSFLIKNETGDVIGVGIVKNLN